MPRKPCYWTRKLELELVEFIRQREFIWKPIANTNYHIQQKYKAYAEFASKQGRGFTARSVRDRWVNIRSTFNHNLRRVDRSKASGISEMYVPCWPLWKPLQFLRSVGRKDTFESYDLLQTEVTTSSSNVKEELESEEYNFSILTSIDSQNVKGNSDEQLSIRQRGQRTDRPRKRLKINSKISKPANCKKVIDDLVYAMKPLTDTPSSRTDSSYWFFGKHVTERLNTMRDLNAECAVRDILKALQEFGDNET